MSQIRVIAIAGFEHGGSRKNGDTFVVCRKHAEKLERAGLVKIADEEDRAELVTATSVSEPAEPPAKSKKAAAAAPEVPLAAQTQVTAEK